MSKIVVEDLTEQTNQNVFEEEYIKKYVNHTKALFIQDCVTYGLTMREVVYALFLMAEDLKQYAIAVGGVIEDYQNVYEWSQKLSTEWIEKLKGEGLLDKIKEIIGNLATTKEKD